MAQHTHKGGDGRFERTQQKVRDWLLVAGWQVKAAEVGEGTAWVLVGTDANGSPIAFAQNSSRPDTLIIQASLTVPDIQVTAIMGKPAEQREGLGVTPK